MVLAATQAETDAHTLTADELKRRPQQFIDGAQRGEPAIVTVAGEPVMMALPLGKGTDSRAMLIDPAATLFDREQISLGLAAQIAGLSYSEMVDELGPARDCRDPARTRGIGARACSLRRLGSSSLIRGR